MSNSEVTIYYIQESSGESRWSENGNDHKDFRYVGEIEKGIPNGFGMLFCPNGDKYEGEWKYGKKHGQGTETLLWKGSWYKGEFRNDKYHGMGLYHYGKRSRYSGEWKDGTFHGKGHLTQADGSTVVGEWVNGKRKATGESIFNHSVTGSKLRMFLEENPVASESLIGVMIEYSNDRLGEIINTSSSKNLEKFQLTILVFDDFNQKVVEWNDLDINLFYLPKDFFNKFEKWDKAKIAEENLLKRQEEERELLEKQKREERESIERQKREERESIERQKKEKEERIAFEKKRAIKLQIISELNNIFKKDFFSADNFYKKEFSENLTENDYIEAKTSFIKSWAKSYKDLVLDDEQSRAIGENGVNIKLVARAGSGKTRTLVNRAIFLQKHCGVPANEILLLAFNKNAAEEIVKRIRVDVGENIPYTMTFHALAWAIVHPEESMRYDDPSEENFSLSRIFQRVIDNHLRDPDSYEKIRNLMIEHFRLDWDKIFKGRYEKSKEEFLEYRRSLHRQSLNGTDVKSYGEKLIANFLFEHNVPFKYERNHIWSGINYRPDFTIFKTTNKSGIIIEYFGMKGDPDYDETSEKKRAYWAKKPEWHLLEYSPWDINRYGEAAFIELLKKDLKDQGFECKKLSEDQIWNQIKDRTIDNFTKTAVGFIGRCRKLFISPDELAKKIASYTPSCDIEDKFNHIVKDLYEAYLDHLRNNEEEDFDGLMQRAVVEVERGNTKFERKSGSGNLENIRYICIDEFQDFSEMFFRLVRAIRQSNKNLEFFCVGDDWQAINGFAGSDLKFYEKFPIYFEPSKDPLLISGNYRSHESIVNLGNKVMAGLGPMAVPKNSRYGDIFKVLLSEFKPTLIERRRHPGDLITPALIRLINKLTKEKKAIVLLSRTNNIPWYIDYTNQKKGRGLQGYLNLVLSFFPKNFHEKISISTVHSYKGMEASTVILIDAKNRRYPFIHPNWVFNQILGETEEKIINEERRLFYVALTRAENFLYIITEDGDETPFLNNTNVNLINWEQYPPKAWDNSLFIVKIGNQEEMGKEPTFQIRELLKANSYIWEPIGDWECWQKTTPVESFKISKIQDENWTEFANGIEVKVLDEKDFILAKFFVNDGKWLKVFDNIRIT